MPKVLPEYLEQRRQQILEAAAGCFARRGFHQSTMQDICDEAELSPGAVYRYFRSKEEIIAGIAELNSSQNAVLVEGAMAKDNTMAAFDELVRAFFLEADPEKLEKQCALLVELISEAPRNEAIRQSLSRTSAPVRDRLAELARQSQARGDISAELDPEAVARTMAAVYHGFITQRLVDPDLDVKAYAAAARALFGGSFWQGSKSTAEPRAATPALQH